ncbi:aminoglycoside phosphotransferase (APT) family kinase protein [Rhizomicrobium palustre]|uniref:Aminoglycoside phosphotransferase (APT) family kinase protein n=1 Tax=Rhizomicrobium palustre TaxID=189966 RepID=A0A846MVA3_9PROT|nr:aminoglycoside phosphotransferase family protein [Rhizomicrobium palustre]NIK87293.1 aminoglycoside phosphotransferase (APT) family kinase protein [Rhizomicrobium palustre]
MCLTALEPSLRVMGLLAPGESFTAEPLAGGISCDVYLVTVRGRSYCVKAALPKLRVAADWRAPADRSHAEVAWMKLVGGIDPDWVPMVLGEDRAHHIFAMEYLPPETHRNWKAELAAGHADPAFAAELGDRLARIHSETAGREDIARDFRNGVHFHALRVDAYLLHTAAKHADVAPIIKGMARNLSAAHIALMHGDISPKNILMGPQGPVFLDAETCSYGDPAFDLAFCLNHLLLKSVWHPAHAAAYAATFTSLARAYFKGASWEHRAGLERRVSGLLSVLLLARIDGKSPVEYLTAPSDQIFVREQAKAFLKDGIGHLDALLERWTEALNARQIEADSKGREECAISQRSSGG